MLCFFGTDHGSEVLRLQHFTSMVCSKETQHMLMVLPWLPNVQSHLASVSAHDSLPELYLADTGSSICLPVQSELYWQ